MRTLIILAGLAAVALGQSADAAIQQQKASIELQRQSIRVQTQNAVAGGTAIASTPSFFTAPWPRTASMPPAFADCDPLPKPQVDALVSDASKKEGVDADLIRSIMQKESAFKPCAISPKGAQGLMQLMPDTAQHFRVNDPFDPKQNVAAGARYLKELLQRYKGDMALALSAYNAGPGRVDRAGGVPDIPETQNYVAEILKQVAFE